MTKRNHRIQETTPNEEAVIKQTLAYSASWYISQFLFVVRGIIIARLLGPSLFGLWQSMKLILGYGDYTHLGIRSALNRELPLAAGQGNNHRVNELIDTGFSSVMLTSVVSGGLVLAASVWMAGKFDRMDIIAARMIALLLVVMQAFAYIALVSKLRKHFFVLSRGELLFSFTNLTMVVILIYFFNFFGLFFGLLFAHLIGILYIYKKCDYRFHISINYGEFKRLVSIGFPIMLFFFLHSFLRTLDKVFILIFFTKTDLGYYGLTAYASDFQLFIPSVVIAVVGPHMTEKFGSTNNIEYLKNHLLVPIEMFSCLIPIISGCIYLCIHLLVNYFLPMYTNAVWSIKIIAVGSFFYCIVHLLIPIIITLNRQKAFLVIVIASIVCGILINWLMIKLNLGITGIAAGMVMTFFVYSIISIFYVLRIYDASIISNLNYLIKIFLPFFYGLLLLGGIEMTRRALPHGIGQEVTTTLINLTAYLLLMSPVIYVFESRHAVFRKTLHIFLRKRSSLEPQ